MGRTLKVVVTGGRCVGKTSVLERAVMGSLRPEQPYIPTIEDIYISQIETEKGHRENVQFYDTAGLDVRNKTILPHYHAMADAYVLVYSVTDMLSFQLLNEIKKDIEKNKEKKDIPIVMLGNKCDLTTDRLVDLNLAESWASGDPRIKVYETSIHDRSSLLEPLVYLTSRLVPQPNKTAFHQLSIGRKNKD